MSPVDIHAPERERFIDSHAGAQHHIHNATKEERRRGDVSLGSNRPGGHAPPNNLDLLRGQRRGGGFHSALPAQQANRIAVAKPMGECHSECTAERRSREGVGAASALKLDLLKNPSYPRGALRILQPHCTDERNQPSRRVPINSQRLRSHFAGSIFEPEVKRSSQREISCSAAVHESETVHTSFKPPRPRKTRSI
ncbi:MAG TPA: hypothetical protein VN041_07280, partial [Microbacterium sp.]|nr:hypothetical protein [Microbacterium sp.]